MFISSGRYVSGYLLKLVTAPRLMFTPRCLYLYVGAQSVTMSLILHFLLSFFCLRIWSIMLILSKEVLDKKSICNIYSENVGKQWTCRYQFSEVVKDAISKNQLLQP